MKLSKVVAATAVLMLVAQVGRAQIAGLPFYPTPTGIGVMASADYANPEGNGYVTAIRGGAGFGPFGATAVIARGSDMGFDNAFGATAAMKLFGGGLSPITIGAQVGLGRWEVGTETVTYMPVGAVVRASIPLFPLKPYAVGYYTLGNNVEKEVRVTVGADFNFLLGLGAHAAYDYGDSGNSWAVGAHFNFRLPVPVP
jgi:hypothetical protein